MLELDRRMLDSKTRVQLIGDALEQLIVELRFPFHDMRGAGSVVLNPQTWR